MVLRLIKYFLLVFLMIISWKIIGADMANTRSYSLLPKVKTGELPELIIKNNNGAQIGKIILGGTDPEAFKYGSVLSYKNYLIDAINKRLIVAVAAAPGGSDTLFAIKIFSVDDGQVKLLNLPEWKTLTEGGLFIGNLPYNMGFGAIVWKPILAPNESHADPHQYKIELYQWNGNVFKAYKQLETKSKYANDADVLKELHIQAVDIISHDFKEFDLYR